MSAFVQMTTTCDDRATLQRIAENLIDGRLAACAQIGGPIQSIYRWQEKVESSEEWYCHIKTTRECVVEVEQAIRKFHSYDEPEILVFDIGGGSDSYLKWLADQTTGPASRG